MKNMLTMYTVVHKNVPHLFFE